jgi:sigma-B regulation protein RsbQ
LLNGALAQAGIDPPFRYVTNAVEHFKLEPWGKRRDAQDGSVTADWRRLPVLVNAILRPVADEQRASPQVDDAFSARAREEPLQCGMDVLKRNSVAVMGPREAQPMLFVHGFGCDQNMWRFVAPAFQTEYRTVLLDLVGAGKSDLSAWSSSKYQTLNGHAEDILEICRALALENVVLVGHSVSAMIGVLAARVEPDRFAKLVLIGPSPRYIDDAGYVGGFSHEDIEQLLESLDSNYLGWSSAMAPVIMGNPERPELSTELENSFCRTDPRIARHFARVTFLSDNRADLSLVRTPTLVLQCSEDVIAPPVVGEYVSRSMPAARLVMMKATGHCPNLSAPEETIAAMRAFLGANG